MNFLPKALPLKSKEGQRIPLHDIAGHVVRLIDPQNRQILESL